MATESQLRAESYWGRELVTPEVDWLGDELCRRTGRPRVAFGSKGDRHHLRGGHRSQEWIRRSRYCTNRTYTVQSGLTAEQERHIAGVDFTPGTAADMIAQSKRLLAAMKAGQLDEVREFYGNVDGDRVVDGWDNVADRAASSDSSHLWHWHLTLDRRHCRNKNLMERILAVALGTPLEDDDMKPTDQLSIADWGKKKWPEDKGLTDGRVTAETAWAGSYLHARLAQERTAELMTMVGALTNLAGGTGAERVLAEIRAQHERTRQAVAGVAPAVLAALPEGDGPVSRDDLEAALRSALGSLDGATPQG